LNLQQNTMASNQRMDSWHAYDVVVQGDVMVAVRDRVRLATDVYLREGERSKHSFE